MLLHEALAHALPSGYGLRDRTEGDAPFLVLLYAQTREDELRPVPWSDEQKRAFLLDQFQKQHAHYLQYYPRARWWVLMRGDQPVGRLYVEQTAREIRLMDVSLLASYRGHGIGTALMRALTAHADLAGVPVTLHVEPFNPATRLYGRMGFVTRETRGVYLFMERPVGAAGAPS